MWFSDRESAITENPHSRSPIMVFWGPILGVLDLSTTGERPSARSEAQSECRETRPVDRTCSCVEIGGDAQESSCPSASPTPSSSDEMGDLAFDKWSVRPIDSGPFGIGLCFAGLLENRLVFVDRDRPAGL